MSTAIRNTAAFLLVLVLCRSTHAQVGPSSQSHGGTTTRITTNGGETIVTTISTNGSSFSMSTTVQSGPQGVTRTHSSSSSGDGAPIDPQAILKAFNNAHATRLKKSAAGAPAKPVTWLGVSADAVSDDLRAQLPLPDGSGLIVRDVADGGPAAQAGVQMNDVLYKVDDQLISTPQQMQALVRAKQSGEKITFAALRKGREMKFNATLGTKIPSAADGDSPEVINLGTFNLDMNKLFGQFGSNNGPVVLHNGATASSTNPIDADALQKSVNDAMKRMMEQMQKAMAAPGN